MNKVLRAVSVSAAAIVLAAGAGLASPARADSPSATTQKTAIATIDQASYTPVLVTETVDSRVYWAPDQVVAEGDSVFAGMSWYVLGQDSTGEWLQIAITPTLNLWVPRGVLAIGNTPLPVIE